MFNPSNYHWTEDLCTEEGMNILKTTLLKEGISLTDRGSSIYRMQRMGNKKINYDLSLTLTLKDKEYRITEYTSLSTPEDIEDSLVKQVFLSSLKRMEEILLSTEKISTPVNSMPVTTVPSFSKASVAKTEKYLASFILRTSQERALDLLFSPDLVHAWSGGEISAKKDPLSFTHPALSFKDISVSKTTDGSNAPVTVTTIACLSAKETLFPLKFTFLPDLSDTIVTLSSSTAPANSSNVITSLFTSVYLSAIRGRTGVPFSVK